MAERNLDFDKITACKKTPIILATLGNDAGIYGSARMVIKEV